jgi:hypothetical protein
MSFRRVMMVAIFERKELVLDYSSHSLGGGLEMMQWLMISASM